MLTKKDAHKAMKALDDWYDPDCSKGTVAGFIEEAAKLLPSLEESNAKKTIEEVSQWSLTPSLLRELGFYRQADGTFTDPSHVLIVDDFGDARVCEGRLEKSNLGNLCWIAQLLGVELRLSPKVVQESGPATPEWLFNASELANRLARCKHATDSADYLAYPCGDPSCERHKKESEAHG